MTGPILAIFCLISVMFLLIGGIIGWLWKEHVVYSTPQQVNVHPEMFDRNGNLIPDEIVALRIEREDYDDEDEDEEEN
jgi:hypothetical protein